MMRNDFFDSFKQMKPKQVLVYHEGNLIYDREQDKEVDRVARAAWQLYETGKCTLLQKRIRLGECAYLLVKS